MERLLLENLAALQAFDAALQQSPSVDRLLSRYAAAVMFEPEEATRRSIIGSVESQLVDHFAGVIQPAAQRMGVATARNVLRGLAGPQNLGDAGFRRQVLLDLQARPQTRLRIVQALVNDKANTLENRLAAYWLEPGANTAQKLKTLRELHSDLEKRRKEYDEKLRDFHAGKLEHKPATPKLDYYSKFVNTVKQDFREQARRSGTDAETAVFVQAGHAQFAWITVQATDACPDCRTRQGVVGDLAFWERLGRPGSGHTVCGAACYCMLVPSATLTQHPSLNAGLVARTKGVLTTEAEALLLASHRP